MRERVAALVEVVAAVLAGAAAGARRGVLRVAPRAGRFAGPRVLALPAMGAG
ncbi:hypothetical protein RHODO2019_05160 [Rhodococcus antarcticus]|uniref:Uncharacterized protein n=1 Tax=Rhodococcus antarcticus TaxID=2987751 RepID=A0ABY6P2F2_9NOCA|nr:hypothetical protein [Rhodococcus antarcticus]UZJ25830.1 hypothetical protein RHODO2019_05160 [Rhodococcus antarcticus]